MAVFAEGNSYGVAGDLIFSFPCVSRGAGKIEIVPQVDWNDFLNEKIALSEKELLEERSLVQHLV
jgi:malate/lactate dehydrogenase